MSPVPAFPSAADTMATVRAALRFLAATDATQMLVQTRAALHEAMRRLVASDLLPERAGHPAKAWAHISLADLLMLDGSSALQQE